MTSSLSRMVYYLKEQNYHSYATKGRTNLKGKRGSLQCGILPVESKRSSLLATLSSEIKHYMSNCSICNMLLLPQSCTINEIPERPWSKVATDLISFNGDSFVVIIDYFSNYIEMERLGIQTSPAMIKFKPFKQHLHHFYCITEFILGWKLTGWVGYTLEGTSDKHNSDPLLYVIFKSYFTASGVLAEVSWVNCEVASELYSPMASDPSQLSWSNFSQPQTMVSISNIVSFSLCETSCFKCWLAMLK